MTVSNSKQNFSPVNATGEEVFPLKLTPFEKYMICDNSVNCPATFTARMIWKGNIDQERWNRSFEKALKLHPFFHAFVRKRGGTCYWILNAQMPQIEWFDDLRLFEAVPLIRFDLRKENGIRVLALTEGNYLTFRIFIHHACSDGMGFISFYNDWFLFYEQDQKEIPKADQPRRDFALLPKRNDFIFPPVTERSPFGRRLFKIIFLAASWLVGRPHCLDDRMYSRKIVKRSYSDFSEKKSSNSDSRDLIELDESGLLIRSHCRKKETDSTAWSVGMNDFPFKLREENGHWIKNMPESVGFRQRIVYGKFDKESTKKLTKYFRDQKMTVTSFFMARFLNRLADPNSGLIRTARRSGLLRIALPFNLRWSGTERLPACNVVSYCFINRRIGQCSETKDFFKEIAEDIFYKKHRNVASFFAVGMKIFAKIPGALWTMIRMPRSLSTAAFSNLGDTDQIFDSKLKREEGKIALENIKLEEIWFSGPCRNRTSLFFAMYSYANELHYAFRYETDKVALNENFINRISDPSPFTEDSRQL